MTTPNAQTLKSYAPVVIFTIVLIIALLLGKKILVALNIIESAEERKSRKKREAAFVQTKDKILSVQSPSINDANLVMLADQLYEALRYSAIGDDKDEAETILKKMRVDADLYRLADLFGTRQEFWFAIPGASLTFSPFVSSNLSRARLDRINENYKTKGITFRF